MLGRMRVALKFTTYGVLIGLLFARRSGSETRRELTGWAKANVGGLFSGFGMGGSNR